MEVQIKIDTNDIEGTIKSLCAALHEGIGLDPAKTEPGVRLAVEGHTAALKALHDASDPEDIGIPASAAFMFAWNMVERSHYQSTIDSAVEAARLAALFDKVDAMVKGR